MTDKELICAWCGHRIKSKYAKDDNGDVYHPWCVSCVDEEDLQDVRGE